jgi:hypothetical protein
MANPTPAQSWRGVVAFALLVVAVLCCRVPEASLSPDGTSVAFVQLVGEETVTLRLGDIASGESRELYRAGDGHGMLRPHFDAAGTLWMLALREDEHLDVFRFDGDDAQLVRSVTSGESGAGFLLPAVIVDERWLWAGGLLETEEIPWQRLDLTTGEVDTPFGLRTVMHSAGAAGDFALDVDLSEGDDEEPADEEGEPEIMLSRLDLARAQLAPLRPLGAEFVGPGRELAVFSQVAVGEDRLAVVVQSPDDAWDAGDADDDTERVAPRAAEAVLLDLDGETVATHALKGVRRVAGHRLTGGDRWLWLLAVTDGRVLALVRVDLETGDQQQLALSDELDGDLDELLFQARLSSTTDGRRVSLQLIGEEVGAPSGRTYVFDGEPRGDLEPLARFGDA